jgi:hypothetical protein
MLIWIIQKTFVMTTLSQWWFCLDWMILATILLTLEDIGHGQCNVKIIIDGARWITFLCKNFMISDDGQLKFLELTQIIVQLLQKWRQTIFIYIDDTQLADDDFPISLFNIFYQKMILNFNIQKNLRMKFQIYEDKERDHGSLNWHGI